MHESESNMISGEKTKKDTNMNPSKNTNTKKSVIALVGAPNSGKTTLYNWLTESKFKTVNYPGATVEYSIGNLASRYGMPFPVMDTPGTYSLFPKSTDEEVTYKALYDHPEFMGSASIKYVLPALVPNLSYKKMHIQEGGAASDTWNRIVSGEYSKEEQDMKIQALKDYCHLDTLAMVEIWKVLNTNK
jgi:hypothetical protein